MAINIKALQEELEGKLNPKNGQKEGGRGIPFVTFALSEETYRKKALGDDYLAMKQKYGWLYDQPISTSEDAEKDKDKEKEG